MKLSTTKQRSTVFFFLSILILFSTSNTGYGQTIDPPLRERTPQIRNAIVAAVPGVNNADDVTAAHLAAITKLNPIFRGITSLKSGDFNGLTALTFLGLSANELTSLPPGIFDELTALTYLGLSSNKLSALPPGIFDELTSLKTLALSINKLRALPPGIFDELTALNYLGLGANKLRALPSGIFNELTVLETLFLHSNNISDISELEGLTALTALQLSRNPISDYGPIRRLVAAITAAGGSLKLDITIPAEFAGGDGTPPAGAGTPASAPVFTEGTTATRTVAENTASGTNIGTAVAATDVDNDTLTYTLGGTDASSFSIVSTSGQLQTNAALDYETKLSYTVTVSVSDGKGGSDSIDVTINVTDVDENRAPAFTDGDNTTRSVAENTASEQDIGSAVSATDPDASDTLTYTLSGADAASFSINSTNGQLQTSATLDYETKKVYAVTITVSDTKLTDTIDVRINVTNVNEAPSFTDGTSTTRTIAENTASEQNIGSAFTATDVDADTTLTYTLSGADAASFSIVSTSGQLQTNAALDFERKSSYSVTITVSDGQLTDSIDVRIDITDVDENRAPAFTDGDNTTRSVAENTASGQNIGSAISATDPDTGDVLTYTLSGADEASFSIVSTSGQLRTQAALDYENKKSYSLTVSVSDGNGGSDSITVAINVTDVEEPVEQPPPPPPSEGAPPPSTPIVQPPVEPNHAPVFSDGTSTTRSIAENTDSGVSIGTAVSATDADNDSLAYTLGGTDAAAFSIVSTSGQLQTRAALDYETKKSYAVTVSVSDGKGGSDSIDVTINVTDVGERARQVSNNAPVFTDGDNTTRTIAENTAAGTNIGNPIAATDADTGDTLTYTLGGTDASAFSIISTSGQLQTSAALDFETKLSYSVTVSVSDGNGGSDSITVTINVSDLNEAPVFTDGDNTTRTIAENTAAGTNVGNPIAATDAENDTLTYYIRGGADVTAFRIVKTTGQLQTRVLFDYEAKDSYTVGVLVFDGRHGFDNISVTINVEDVDEPVFTEGDNTTRTIAENTAAGTNIGNPIAATAVNTGDTLTYSLADSGNRGEPDNPYRWIDPGDSHLFSIVSTNGQLRTKYPFIFDYERKTSHSAIVIVSDDNSGTDIITVTINVTNVNEAPSFTGSVSTIRTILEGTAAGMNIGSPVSATDPENDPLTYTLSGTDAASFSIVSTNGQLRTSAALSYETKSLYFLTITVSDGSFTDSINVTISVAAAGETTINPPLSQRTQQVRDAIVTAVNVDSADDVTPAHLAAISNLYLRSTGITSLKTGDFAGLTNLQSLRMDKNSISDISPLANLTSLTDLILHSNAISDISPLEGLTNLKHLNLMHNSISDISALDDLTTLTNLGLNNNSISDISALDDLTALTTLLLSNNSISDISALDDLTALKDLGLYGNSISDISALSSLTSLELLGLSKNSISNISALSGLTSLRQLQLGNNSIGNISALSGLTLLRWLRLSDNSISDISALAGLTRLRELYLNNNSITDVSALENLTSLRDLQLNGNTISDYAPLHRLIAAIAVIEYHPSEYHPSLIPPGLTLDITIPAVGNNNAPVFTDGDDTTRAVAENTAAGTNIGAAVAATDADTGDTLTYHLGGTDAASFGIVRTSGQLQTKAALDYETTTSYTVTVAVSDGKGGTDNITVAINVTDAVGAASSVQVSPMTPDKTVLLTNFPNPFNPETWIPYQLAKPAEVTLTIYDIRGVVVRELKLGHQAAGVYYNRSRAIYWDGRNAFGEKVATGVYFYTLKAGDFTATRKLLIRK